MGGNGKNRWKISIYHRHKPSQPPPEPPQEFLCPISRSLMSDPVIVHSGQTFDRLSLQICQNLGYTPNQTTPTDFSTLIPNLALKSTILSWCDSTGTVHPTPPDHTSLENIVRAKIAESSKHTESPIRVSERELLNGVVDNPPVLFSHANTELTHRVNHFCSSSSSSDESVIVSTSTAGSPLIPLPLTTKPACFSSCSTSSEIAETLSDNPNCVGFGSKEEEEIIAKLKSVEVHEQEEGVVSLRKMTRTREESRVSLCTPRLMMNLRPLIASRYAAVRTNAVASLVNLSLEKVNKVNIVRSGFVPPLIDVLKSGCIESQEHAAGALFSLALEDENKMAIGVLGALQPLMHALRSESERTGHDSALALYHLSLIQSNRVKLVKLGAVPTLLSMVRSGEATNRLLLILCNLASCSEGRSATLDANAVEILVGLLREGNELVDSEVVRENCVAVLFALSHGSLRFKGLAKEAKAGEVLKVIEEKGSERAKQKAKRILQMMKGREEEEVDWENVLDSDGIGRMRYRVGADSQGPNSSNF